MSTIWNKIWQNNIICSTCNRVFRFNRYLFGSTHIDKMPTERPIIPKGMPNPIGRAVFEGTKNPRRIGGELPVYKYPLVSKAPKQFSQKAKLVSTNQVRTNFSL